MNERAPLPSPVDLPAHLVAQAIASESGGYVAPTAGAHAPGALIPLLEGERLVEPRPPETPLPEAGPGVILMRLGDVKLGTLIIDSAARKVLGRVVRWNISGGKARGKALRRRIVIEVEESTPAAIPAAGPAEGASK